MHWQLERSIEHQLAGWQRVVVVGKRSELKLAGLGQQFGCSRQAGVQLELLKLPMLGWYQELESGRLPIAVGLQQRYLEQPIVVG